MELSKVLNQDREVELGNKTFKIGKLTLNDQAKFDIWIDKQVVEEAKTVLKDLGKEADVDSYLKLKCNDTLRAQVAGSTSATIQLIYILISKKNDIGYDEFAELLTIEDLPNINEIFGVETGEDSEAEKNLTDKK